MLTKGKYGLHGRLINPERIQVETTQMDMTKAYREWKEKRGQDAADESKAKFIEVEFLPEKDDAQLALGKKATLYLNPKTKATWYEYTDRPMENSPTLTAKLDELTASIALLNDKMDAMEQAK